MVGSYKYKRHPLMDLHSGLLPCIWEFQGTELPVQPVRILTGHTDNGTQQLLFQNKLHPPLNVMMCLTSPNYI
jgi:hypothetical protein